MGGEGWVAITFENLVGIKYINVRTYVCVWGGDCYTIVGEVISTQLLLQKGRPHFGWMWFARHIKGSY